MKKSTLWTLQSVGMMILAIASVILIHESNYWMFCFATSVFSSAVASYFESKNK